MIHSSFNSLLYRQFYTKWNLVKNVSLVNYKNLLKLEFTLESYKLGCVAGMVIDSILSHAECGQNEHREDASPFNLNEHESLKCSVLFGANSYFSHYICGIFHFSHYHYNWSFVSSKRKLQSWKNETPYFTRIRDWVNFVLWAYFISSPNC